MKKVYLADSPLMAHLVAGLLRDEGIECTVQGENLRAGGGELPLDLSTQPAVCVLKDEDADRAVAFLEKRKKAIAHAEETGEFPAFSEFDTP